MTTLSRSTRVPRRRLSRGMLGLLVLVVTALLVLVVYNKERVATTFTPGTTLSAQFAEEWPLVPYRSDVKMAGVVVGTVTGVEGDGTGTQVSMKIDDDAADKLGDSPTANIREKLLLGGSSYVDLIPGGTGAFSGETIPPDRTTLPVKLGEVLAAITPEAQVGIRKSIGQTGAVLRQGGRDAARRLLREAPGTMGPAGEVLEAARGTRPAEDLTATVSGLESAARVLTRNDGQLSSIWDSMKDSTAAFADESGPVADAVGSMPETLRATRAGMVDLRGTLDLLGATAERLRPAARELGPMLADLDPVLVRTRPVLNELRPVLTDARPLVGDLVPVTGKATAALEDVRGPVLDRLNGPIAKTIMSPWRGTGRYAGGGATGNRLYEELGFLIEHAAHAYQYYDKNGGFARLAPGVGGSTFGGAGTPMSLEQYLEHLGLDEPGPDADAGRGGPPPLPGTERSGGSR